MVRATSSDGRCTVLWGALAGKYHSSRRDAFKSINQDPIAHVEFGTEGPRIIMEELDPQDARSEAISPTMFDDTVGIAQFVSDGHLHSDIVNSAVELGYDAFSSMEPAWVTFRYRTPQGDSPENTKLGSCSPEGTTARMGECDRSHADRARAVHLDVYSKGRFSKR